MILQQPDAVSLSGNIKDLILSSSEEKEIVIQLNDITVYSGKYVPDTSQKITVKLKDIISTLLSVPAPGTEEVSSKDIDRLVFVAGDDRAECYCIKGGVAGSVSADTFLRASFLTWQPQSLKTFVNAPLYIRYASLGNYLLKVKAYFADGTNSTKTIYNCVANKIYTFNVSFQVITGKFGKTPSYFDIWVSDTEGANVSFIQRYALSNARANDDLFLFENSIGGMDTICFSGIKKESTELETLSAMQGDDLTVDYDIDFARAYTKDIGYFPIKILRGWVTEFFRSTQRYHLTEDGIVPVVISNPNIASEKFIPSSYNFTFAYSKNEKYLNFPRLESPPEVIEIIDPDHTVFPLAPRLYEFPLADVGADPLIPVQHPFTDTWRYLPVSSIVSSGGGGGGGSDIEIIPTGGEALPTNKNVFSALRSLEEFHPKGGKYTLEFLAKNISVGSSELIGVQLKSTGLSTFKLGIDIGDFVAGSSGASIIANGDAQFGQLVGRNKVAAYNKERNNVLSLDFAPSFLPGDTRSYPFLYTDFPNLYFSARHAYSAVLGNNSETGEQSFWLNNAKPDVSVTEAGRIKLNTNSLSRIKSGIVIGEDEFIAGLNGVSSRIDSAGNADFNNLTVRGSITANEFIANQYRASNGSVITSDCVFLKAAPYTYTGLNGFEWINTIKGQELGYGFAVPFSVGDILNFRRVVADSGGVKSVINYYTKVTYYGRESNHGIQNLSFIQTGWLYKSMADLAAGTNAVTTFPFFGDNDTWVREDNDTDQKRRGWINMNASPYFGESPQISCEVGISGYNNGGSVAQMGKLTLDGINNYYGFMLKSPGAGWRDSVFLAYYSSDTNAYAARIGPLWIKGSESLFMFNDYYAGNYGGVNFDKVDTGAQILVHSGKSSYVQLLYNTGGIWGIRGNVNASLVFQLGSTNNIAGWNFDNNALYTGVKATVNQFSSSGITLFSSGAISAKNFLIDTSGNAELRGKITATSGSIGGVAITNNYIGIDASNTGAGNIGSFLAARYLGLRSGSNYFRADTGAGNALQVTIKKTTDTTAALSIENGSTDSVLKLGVCIQSYGSNYFYGYNAVQFLGGSSMNTDTTNSYVEVSNQGVVVNIPVDAIGPNSTKYRGHLVLKTVPGPSGSLTEVYFKRA